MQLIGGMQLLQDSHEKTNIKNPMVILGFLVVVDNSSTITPIRVDTTTSDGNGSHENGKPNNKGRQHKNVGVTSIPLKVNGWENNVDKHESANNLNSQSSSLVVAISHNVNTTTKGVALMLHESFSQPNSI